MCVLVGGDVDDPGWSRLYETVKAVGIFLSASVWDLAHLKEKSVVWVEPMLCVVDDPKFLGRKKKVFSAFLIDSWWLYLEAMLRWTLCRSSVKITSLARRLLNRRPILSFEVHDRVVTRMLASEHRSSGFEFHRGHFTKLLVLKRTYIRWLDCYLVVFSWLIRTCK